MCMYTLNMVQTYSDVTILIKFETYFFFKMRHAKQLLMGSYANFINICFRYNVLQLNEWKFTHLTNVYFRILVIFSEMQNMIWFWFWLIDPTQRKIVFIKRRHFYRLAWPWINQSHIFLHTVNPQRKTFWYGIIGARIFGKIKTPFEIWIWSLRVLLLKHFLFCFVLVNRHVAANVSMYTHLTVNDHSLVGSVNEH